MVKLFRPFVRDKLCGCAARNDDPGAARGFGPSRLTANRAGARTPRARAQLLLSRGFADTPSFRRRFIFAGGGACLYDQVTQAVLGVRVIPEPRRPLMYPRE